MEPVYSTHLLPAPTPKPTPQASFFNKTKMAGRPYLYAPTPRALRHALKWFVLRVGSPTPSSQLLQDSLLLLLPHPYSIHPHSCVLIHNPNQIFPPTPLILPPSPMFCCFMLLLEVACCYGMMRPTEEGCCGSVDVRGRGEGRLGDITLITVVSDFFDLSQAPLTRGKMFVTIRPEEILHYRRNHHSHQTGGADGTSSQHFSALIFLKM